MTDLTDEERLYARSPAVENVGSKLLFQDSSGLERAWADVTIDGIIRIPDWVITDQWDPYLISENNLPYLAWGMGVNLWEDVWSVGVKREWVAAQWLYKSMRGAPAAYRMALGLSGYEITDMVRPPQGFFLSPELTKEQYDTWIHRMPELRITYQLRYGLRNHLHFFFDAEDPDVGLANVGFLDHSFIMPNDGWELYGRLAVIRHHGTDTPVHSIEYHPHFEQAGVVDFERFSTIGDATHGFVLDRSFIDDPRPRAFIGAADVEPKLYTIRLDRSYAHDLSELSLTTVVPDLEPITPRYERNSDIGTKGPWLHLDHSFFGQDEFLDRVDGGDRMLADRVFLLDPAVQAPMNEGISFLDHSRIGLEKCTAEVQVDLHTREPRSSFFIHDSYIDAAYLTPENDGDRRRAMRAIRDAKALRDTILVAFDPVRPLRVGDPVTASTRYGDWVPARL